MIKIGKVGKNRINANKEIKKQCDEKNIHSCEVKLNSNCWGSYEIHPAHKHKSIWYRSCPELLYNFFQWVMACPYCHDQMEPNRKLTLEIFKRLRPKTKNMPKITNKSKSIQKKGKKVNWMLPHKCIHCKTMLTGLYCRNCGNLST